MLVLGIETSCDETSVAVVEKRGGTLTVIRQEIASQIELHRAFGGVVPEVATRQHLLRLDPMVRGMLPAVPLADLDGVAVTVGPGLATSLLVGASYAKSFALAAGQPWLGVNHLEGHLFSPFLSRGVAPDGAHLALIVSGGHTLLVHAPAPFDYRVLGSTLDDAAGESFDKVAKLLGLPYPGGPEVERLARQGNPAAVAFPRGMLDSGDFNFSFSGLKTSVRTHWHKERRASLPDICASFQQAVTEVLVKKTMRAARQHNVRVVTLSGGVSGNQFLCAAFAQAAERDGLTALVADPRYSTDNAAMIAAVAACRFERGERSPWDLDVNPNLRLAGGGESAPGMGNSKVLKLRSRRREALI
ncbi:MAG: tRNA (adenosine(37)-N6)-threonylcarbamoyltransferase complex transferase subunit TsaD [Verrucomicrobiales bacterium]|jgi:N6-L-threonylcarbamoyladenine synthase|nr:tRNA (adenosine(37)-N6)-threonylcarbamoyltransferase complex transferase subunit TsaD [Verrucomicrobiales bacterium]